MSAATRRGLLAGLPALALVPSAALATPSPDAVLIAACDAYQGLMDAVNNGAHGDNDDGPAWRAYEACRDAVSKGAPETMPGMLAMCRAIRAEARGRDGEPIGLHGMSADWALDVVNALLRLNGGAA